MRRRQFLLGSGLAASSLLAGCTGDSNSESPTQTTQATTSTASTTTATTDPAEPDGIYVQTFRETMSMQGTATAGDYTVALMFSIPHVFWTMTGWERSETPKEGTNLHLMAVVWDRESGTTLPDAGLSVELYDDADELVSQEVIYPMLSQPMGFHYGGNFQLPESGTYTATVSIGGISARPTGSFEGRFQSAETVEMELSFTDEAREKVSSRSVEGGGQPGAVEPMDTSYPKSVAPGKDSLPGTMRGTAAIDDAYLVVTDLDSAARVSEPDSRYLAVSARTRYNKYELSGMGLDATLVRDGEAVYDGALERTLSPDMGYHHGAPVDSVQSGDELTLSASTPPQVARHEGYETAFLQMRPDVTLTL